MNRRPRTARLIARTLPLAAWLASGGVATAQQSPTYLPDAPAGSNVLPAPGGFQVRSPGGAPENLPVPSPFGLPPFLPGSDPYQPGGQNPIPPFGPGPLLGPFTTPRFGLTPFGQTLPALPTEGTFGVPTLPAIPSDDRAGAEELPGQRFGAVDITLPSPGYTPLLPEPPATAARSPLGPLSLDQVLASIDNAYPPLLQVILERGVAAGELLAVNGAFDLDIKFDIRNYVLGYYKRIYHSYYFEQPTTWNGVKFFGGYRMGLGEIPIYLFPFRTYRGGEFLAGLEFPFLKNRAIDAKRAKLWQQQIERQKVEPKIQQYRIETIRKATKAYWNWVNAGQRYEVLRDLLDLAVVRNDALLSQLKQGQIRAVLVADNQQFILQRESDLLGARRDFQQASIELSLFLRDRYGLPCTPEAEMLPPLPNPLPPQSERLREDIYAALQLRPELREISLQLQKMDIELRFARNQRLPGLNLYLYGSQDVGVPTYPSPATSATFSIANQGPFALETSLLFDVPLQRRMARGREQSASAIILQLRRQEQFARDTIAAEVKLAMSSLQASYFQMIRARKASELAEQLEEAERRTFELGGSNVLSINVREVFTASARIKALDAETKVLTSEADYRAALGLDALLPDGRKPPIVTLPPSDPTAVSSPPPTAPAPRPSEPRPLDEPAEIEPPPLPSPNLPPR